MSSTVIVYTHGGAQLFAIMDEAEAVELVAKWAKHYEPTPEFGLHLQTQEPDIVALHYQHSTGVQTMTYVLWSSIAAIKYVCEEAK